MTTATATAPAPKKHSTGRRHAGIYTTGEVARMCKVAPRTISKWCDGGLLKHYKIPGSADRRVTAAELVKFLKAHDYPLPPELLVPDRVLLVGFPAGAPEIGVPHDLAGSAFEAGVKAAAAPPAVIVADVAAFGRLDASALAAAAGRLEPPPLLIAVWSEPVPGFDLFSDAGSLSALLALHAAGQLPAVRGPRP